MTRQVAQKFFFPLLYSLLFFFSFAGSSFAQNFPSVAITQQDRILILAPHPDDEAIGVGGVIQRTVRAKAAIKIVYLTNGDGNELSFLVYKKRPILSRKGLLNMGELRRRESIAAMQALGVDKRKLIFLGYPDLGGTNIFVEHWGDKRPPLKSILTRVSAVPYKHAYSPKASYKGESIVADLKKILQEFQPTKIFVTLPIDTNIDHQAYYLFLQVALWDMEGKMLPYEIYPYVVHLKGWPRPRGFHPELSLIPPEQLVQADINWYKFSLNPREIKRKKDSISYYKSQNAYNPKYLLSFVRKNELFGRFRDIQLHNDSDIIDWENEEPKQKVRSHLLHEKQGRHKIIKTMTYAQSGKYLYVRLKVNNWKSKLTGINLFLVGYSKKTPFVDLPKIRVKISFDKFVTAYDQRRLLSIPDMQFTHKGDILILRFPLSNLGFPDYILSNARTYFGRWSLEATPWRKLIVDDDYTNQ